METAVGPGAIARDAQGMTRIMGEVLDCNGSGYFGDFKVKGPESLKFVVLFILWYSGPSPEGQSTPEAADVRPRCVYSEAKKGHLTLQNSAKPF